jgi:hypothetical protein
MTYIEINKKASEKINAAMFLLYLVLIASGVVIVLSSYVNTPVDIRGHESQILYDKIMNCFVSGGFVKDEVLGSNFDVFSKCALNKSIIDSSHLYFEFSFRNDTDSEIKSFLGGDSLERIEKKQYCAIIYSTETKNVISCLFRNETYLYSNGTDIVNVKIVGWVSSDNNGVRL